MATTSIFLDPWERKETLWLLELRIALLPDTAQKVLALYYHENARLSQIAECLGLTQSEINRIRAEAVAGLRREVLSFMRFHENPSE